MMDGYLLDTHFLIWWRQGNKRKLDNAKAFIEANKCFASPVSIWEMRQKPVLPLVVAVLNVPSIQAFKYGARLLFPNRRNVRTNPFPNLRCHPDGLT